jgi:hypothetical protein
VKRTERFGRPGFKKAGPRPAPWTVTYRGVTYELHDPHPAPPSRWSVRLRSLGGWLLSSRFPLLRSLGGRWLRTGAFF